MVRRRTCGESQPGVGWFSAGGWPAAALGHRRCKPKTAAVPSATVAWRNRRRPRMEGRLYPRGRIARLRWCRTRPPEVDRALLSTRLLARIVHSFVSWLRHGRLACSPCGRPVVGRRNKAAKNQLCPRGSAAETGRIAQTCNTIPVVRSADKAVPAWTRCESPDRLVTSRPNEVAGSMEKNEAPGSSLGKTAEQPLSSHQWPATGTLLEITRSQINNQASAVR